MPTMSHTVVMLPLILYKIPIPAMSCTVIMPLPLTLYKCPISTISHNVIMPPLISFPLYLVLIPSDSSMLLCFMPLPLSTLYNYAQKFWIKLISSSLLEFYIRAIFVILQSFDIVIKNDFPLYKCQQINLTLKRHFYRRYDYNVLANKLTYCSAICIYSTPMFINFFINYIVVLKVIYIFIFKPVLCSGLYLFDVLIYDTYYQIILCYKDLDYFKPETTKTTGGGPSYELNYDDLFCYLDQVRKNLW